MPKLAKAQETKLKPNSMKKSSSLGELLSFTKDTVAGTPVPRVASFGMIAMAAIALLAMLPVAQIELSESPDVPNMALRSAVSVTPGLAQVLGQQTFEKSLVYANANVKVWAKPDQYDSITAKWSYIISWARQGKRQGSIFINGNSFVENASGSGEQSTGFSLSPGATYSVTYFSLVNGKGVKVAKDRPFTVLAAQDTTAAQPADEVEDNGAPLPNTTGGKKNPMPLTTAPANTRNGDKAPPTNSSDTSTTDKPVVPHFEFLNKDIPQGTVGVPYSAKIYFRYVIAKGATNFASNAKFRGLPAGVGTGSSSGNDTVIGILPGLEGPNGLASVTIHGTPTSAGTFKVNLALTDQYTANADQSFALNIAIGTHQ